MTYIIAEPCIDIKDRSCVDVCPVDCIHEAGRILVIDPEECIDCGACEPECPVEAIFPEDALPEKWAPFVQINYAYDEGMDVVNGLTTRTRPSTTSRTSRWSRSEPTGGVGRIRFWIRMVEDPHELSALYALDALTGEDLARFEAHLAECPRCRRELAGLQGAAASLAFAVEGPEPSPALRVRVLDAAHAEKQNVVPLRPRRRSLGVSVAAVVAVAACAAAVVLGVWAASLHHSLARDRTALNILGDPSARRVAVTGAPGQLVVASDGAAVLAVRLPSPPHGKTYEAWVADSAVHRAGQFSGKTFALQRRVAHGARVMVTLENKGGVDAPTSKPLLSARA